MGIFESIITTLLLFFGLGAFLFAGVFGTVSSMLFFKKKSTLKSYIPKLTLCIVLFILGPYTLQHTIDKVSDINQGVLIVTAIVALIAYVFVSRELEKYMKDLEKNQ